MLAWRQPLERVIPAAGADELLYEARVDDRAASRDPVDRVDELGDVGDAALEQVADPLARREQLHRLVDLDVRGEHENSRCRELLADDACRVESLGGVRRWHPNVDDDDLGFVCTNESEERRGIAGLADDLESVPFEQRRETLSQQDVVIRERDARATFAHRGAWRMLIVVINRAIFRHALQLCLARMFFAGISPWRFPPRVSPRSRGAIVRPRRG